MRGELHHRQIEADLEVRSSGDGRTVYGLAVPYGLPQRVEHNLIEQFARGAFAEQVRAPHRVRFTRDHLQQGGSLIGVLTMMRDDPSGLYIEARISRTTVGDETLELIRDGALRHLSIGFQERQNRPIRTKLGPGVERVTARLVEVSSVLQGAYGDHAVAAGVRSAPVETPNLRRAQQISARLRELPPAV